MDHPNGLIYWSAGEASGDHHGAEVIGRLRRLAPGIRHRGLGGDAMASAGMQLDLNLARDFAIIGFTRAALAYPKLRRILLNAVDSWTGDRPDLVVCVDYPGFNLELARRAHLAGIPVLWYISPQVWAWKEGRVKRMRRDLRRVFVILPFEEAWLRDRGVRADYLGNPLLDELPDVRAPQLEAREALGFGAEDVVIGLLPGSRSREILRHMPLLVQTVQRLLADHPHLKFVLPIAPTVDRGSIEQALATERPLPVTLTTDNSRARLAMNAALCKSGTSTLELAVAGVPMVIFYITSWLNALIVRMILTIPHIGLVNLVAGRGAAVECVQHDANPVTLSRELAAILPGTEGHRRQLEDLAQVREKLGGGGASDRVAEAILEEFRLLRDQQT